MLRMLISPKTTPSASVAKTVAPSSETTVSLPRLMMYNSLPMSPFRQTHGYLPSQTATPPPLCRYSLPALFSSGLGLEVP